MDDHQNENPILSFPSRTAIWYVEGDENLPEDFTPLRLVLQPGRMSIEVRRPNVLLGRHSDADIRLPLPDVSRHHCRFIHDHGAWRLLDLNSLNGCYVNDREVKGSAPLKEGDHIRVGGFTFRVEMADPAVLRQPKDAEGMIQNIFEELKDLEHRRAS